MRKGILICLLIALLGAVALWLVLFSPLGMTFVSNTSSETKFRAYNKEIQIWDDGSWQPFEIIGVNVGTGYPGLYPNENGIDEDTYYRWFEMISEMNANTVRVYQIQSPEFYNAFLRFNNNHERKLFLIQGMDFSDHLMYSEENIFNSEVKQKIFDETNELVNALHGRCVMLDPKAGILAVYLSDVSDYVLGYVLGVEWDELFVEYTCRMNPELKGFEGTYLYCEEDANPFEVFLGEWGNNTLEYEQTRYAEQKLISFCNWPYTDPFKNKFLFTTSSEEARKSLLEVSVDLEHIHTKETVRGGLFASYNIYPYFPYFLQYGEYTQYIDDTGKRNPYRKYLMELVEYHSYPVVVSEFGVPASRSVAYDDIWHQIKHGGLTEQEQGEGILKLYEDIQKASCAGCIVFSWQDEWYKTIWNEKYLSDPDGRAYWSNAQSAEEYFGLLAFEPGKDGNTAYPDGDLSEWIEDDLVFRNGNLRMYMQSDEKYVYFLVEGLDAETGHNEINIALDVTPKSGALLSETTNFDRAVDFLIRINSTGSSALLVQNYYDTFAYSILIMYDDPSAGTVAKTNSKRAETDNPISSSDRFLVVSRGSNNILNQMQFQWIRENVGQLKEGNANPNSPDYDSNADFFVSGDSVEIRIPWQMLNFYDPSKRLIIDDYRANNYQIKGLEIDRIYAAAYYDDQTEVTQFGAYELKSWETPQFHERLKQSYYILQEAFGREKAS